MPAYNGALIDSQLCSILQPHQILWNIAYMSEYRRMKWKKENKAKVEGGEGGDESPEPPNMWSEANISWTNVLGTLADWSPRPPGVTTMNFAEVVFDTFVSIHSRYNCC